MSTAETAGCADGLKDGRVDSELDYVQKYREHKI